VRRGVQKLRDSAYVRVLDARIEVADLEPLRQLLSVLSAKDDIRAARPVSGEAPSCVRGGCT